MITVSYVYYFNKKYKRIGHLFQDRFKSEAVEDDSYILSLSRYIHLNPVEAGIAQDASEYQWSSYRNYIGYDISFDKVLDTASVLNIFPENKKAAVSSYVEYMKEDANDSFIDIIAKDNTIDEEDAKNIFAKMLSENDIDCLGRGTDPALALLIKDFKAKTNLSIRKIAVIAGINKDKVNRLLKT